MQLGRRLKGRLRTHDAADAPLYGGCAELGLGPSCLDHFDEAMGGFLGRFDDALQIEDEEKRSRPWRR